MDKYDLYGKIAIPKKHNFEFEVPELYRIVGDKQGVFVNSALTEPFGLSLIEAAACGVPLISTRVGIAPELINDYDNGILVDRTVADIRRAVVLLRDNPEMRIHMGKSARRTIEEQWTWDRQAPNYIPFFDSGLQGSG